MENEVQPFQKFKTPPLKHQLACLNQFGKREFFALNSEQGTGKTWIIINDAADLWADHTLDAVLVLAPNGVHYNWTIIELPNHMPEWVRYRAVAWNANAGKKERCAIQSILQGEDSTELRILTMNWEALATDRGFEFAKNFVTSCRRLLIAADESQRMKNPQAERTKALMKLKVQSSYRRTMSGTPITNGPFDAFAQYSFLDETILGTSSYYAFKSEYAEMLSNDHGLIQHIVERKVALKPEQKRVIESSIKALHENFLKNGRFALIEKSNEMVNLVDSGIFSERLIELNAEIRELFNPAPSKGKFVCLELMMNVDNIIAERMRKVNNFKNSNRIPQIVQKDKSGAPRYKNLDKLEKLIAPHTFRVTKAECLDLPEKVYKNLWFDLTADQRSAYDLLKDEFRIVVEDQVSPVHRLAALTKMSQISSGFYINSETGKPIYISSKNPKLELFRERIKDAVEDGLSIIVWARFIEELKSIERVLEEEGIAFGRLYGEVKKLERIESIRAFQAGEIPVFISQQQAGGTGITLTRASEVFYYSNDYSLENRLQSEDRAHRIGTKQTVNYTNFMARNTIDEAIAQALINKKKIADIVTGDAARKLLLL